MSKIRYKLVKKLPQNWVHHADPIGTIFFKYYSNEYTESFRCENPDCIDRHYSLLIARYNIKLLLKPIGHVTIKESIYGG